MLGFMETEKEFIKNWEKYRGAAGCLPAVSRLLVPFWDYRYSPDADGNQSGYMVYGTDGSAGGRSCHFFRARFLALYSSFPAYRAGHVG